MFAMAQSASTLDDRPLPEADDPAVRTLLPSSPENAVVAVDACGRHASARAALIYQHASDEQDVLIAERLSAMIEEALRKSDGDTRGRGPRRRSAESGRNG
jgi:hypothetical protein